MRQRATPGTAPRVKTSFAIKPEALAALKAEAQRQDRSVSYILEKIILRELERLERRKRTDTSGHG
jgi:hypothetical protein